MIKETFVGLDVMCPSLHDSGRNNYELPFDRLACIKAYQFDAKHPSFKPGVSLRIMVSTFLRASFKHECLTTAFNDFRPLMLRILHHWRNEITKYPDVIM